MASFKDWSPQLNDDIFTSENLFKQLSKYVPKNKIVSMPFYSPYSNCDKLLSKYIDNKIIYQEEDFFKYDRGDIIVDNPPFSIKKLILKELLKRDKPFMLILPITCLCYKYNRMFKDKDIQILIPNGRPKYNFCKNGVIKYNTDSAPFDTIILCYKIGLKKDIIFMD